MKATFTRLFRFGILGEAEPVLEFGDTIPQPADEVGIDLSQLSALPGVVAYRTS